MTNVLRLGCAYHTGRAIATTTCGATTDLAYWTSRHPCGKEPEHRGPHVANVCVYADKSKCDEWLIWRDGEKAKLYGTEDARRDRTG